MAASAGFVRRSEGVKWTVNAQVAKWTPDQVGTLRERLGYEPTAEHLRAHFDPELLEQPGNMLLTAGLGHIMGRIIANTNQAVDNTHTRIGVGNSSAAEAVGQIDLQAAAGAANRFFMTMDTGYPSTAGGVLTARATFGANDGNFVWNEWGIDVNTAATAATGTTVANVLINRKVAALGTKASGAVWQLATTITLA